MAENKETAESTQAAPETTQETKAPETTTPEKQTSEAPQVNPEMEELRKELKDLKAYQESATPLIQAVYGDPDIQALIKQKTTATPAGNTSDSDTKVDNKLREVDLTMRANIIGEFDRKFGIKPEEQEEVHKKIASELQSLGQDARSISLDKLPQALDKAFRLSHEERYTNGIRSQSAAQTMNNLNAQLPTQSGGSLTGSDGTTQLNNDQKEWVDKLVGTDGKKSAQEKTQEVLKKYGTN